MVLQICLGMADGVLLVGTGEAKVSVKRLANLQVFSDEQKVFTAGGAMPGYQSVSRVGFAPDRSWDGLWRCMQDLEVAILHKDQPVAGCRLRRYS